MRKIAIIVVLIIIVSLFSGCISLKNEEKASYVRNSGDVLDIDSDSDGWTDKVDSFPFDPAAYLDSDGDGYPDSWVYKRSQDDSTSNPKLELDMFPGDPSEWKDSDMDGFGDNKDVFPTDPSEHLDSDYDGVGDNRDINPVVDLSFELFIDEFRVKEKMDVFRWMQIYFTVYVDNVLVETFDNENEYWETRLYDTVETDCSLKYDIEDNTSDLFTKVEIYMMDYDFFGSDDVIEKITVEIDNIQNTVSFSNPYTGVYGDLWYDIVLSQNGSTKKTLDRYYKWSYNGESFETDLEIPIVTYETYSHNPVDRIPQGVNEDAMVSFITYEDEVVEELADKLFLIGDSNGFNRVETVNFVLSFVQNIVSYQADNKTTGFEEYWRFPVETLVDMQGDCEDTAVLFSALIKNLGYDVVLLYYTFEDSDLGHLSSGVNVNEDVGDYVISSGEKFYYCETTAPGFKIGEKPTDLNDEPELIMSVK